MEMKYIQANVKVVDRNVTIMITQQSHFRNSFWYKNDVWATAMAVENDEFISKDKFILVSRSSPQLEYDKLYVCGNATQINKYPYTYVCSSHDDAVKLKTKIINAIIDYNKFHNRQIIINEDGSYSEK